MSVFMTDMAYVAPPAEYDTLKSYKRRLYDTLLTLLAA
jgi:hypothetical protein